MKKSRITVFLLYASFIADMLFGLAHHIVGFNSFLLLPMIIRSFFIFWLVYLLYGRFSNQVIKIGALFVFLSAIIGHLTYQGFIDDADLLTNFTYFTKYIYFLLFFIAFKDGVFSNKITYTNTEIIVKAAIIIYSFSIIVGYTLNIESMNTYEGAHRPGSKGIFFAPNEATLFFYCMFVYSLLFVKAGARFNLYFFIVLISGIFLGTKGFYLAVIVFLILFYVKNKIFMSFAFIFAYFFLLNFDFLIEYFMLGHFVDKHGYLTAISSGRDIYIEERFLTLVPKWTPLNFLFGGTDVNSYYIESDLFDLFLVFGIVGSLIYVLTLVNSFLLPVRYHRSALPFFVGLIMLALGSGHILTSVSNCIFILVVVIHMSSFNKYSNR